MIKFVQLPEDENFMPELQCEVYDNILSGYNNSLIGIFSIDVKRIIKRTKAQVIEDINQADRNNGLAFAQSFLLNQLNNVDSRLNSISSKSNNIIDNGGGMKENNIDNENDNIINEKQMFVFNDIISDNMSNF